MRQSYMGEEVSLERALSALFQAAFKAEMHWECIPLFFGFSLDDTTLVS
jgi:hypothetical protein